MIKELEALGKIKETIIPSTRSNWETEYYYVGNIEAIKKHFDIIEEALNELEDAKHNYKAVKEMYDNAVAYSTKIQKELNEIKKQEKLLELYRYLDENTNDYDLNYDVVDEIHKQIKELENE